MYTRIDRTKASQTTANKPHSGIAKYRITKEINDAIKTITSDTTKRSIALKAIINKADCVLKTPANYNKNEYTKAVCCC